MFTLHLTSQPCIAIILIQRETGCLKTIATMLIFHILDKIFIYNEIESGRITIQAISNFLNLVLCFSLFEFIFGAVLGTYTQPVVFKR